MSKHCKTRHIIRELLHRDNVIKNTYSQGYLRRGQKIYKILS